MPRRFPPLNLGGAFRICLAPIQSHRDAKERKRKLFLHGEQRGRTILIDPRSSYPLHTLIHELYHMQYPGAPEHLVRKWEKQWMKNSTWKERARAIKLLARATTGIPEDYLG